MNDLFTDDGPHRLMIVGATAVAGIVSLMYLFQMLFKSRNPKVLPLEDFLPLPLIRKEVLSHDTRRFTFALPSPEHVLGLPTGQHISLKYTGSDGKAVQRSYTPVSDNNTKGEVSLCIKVYKPSPPKFPNGGKMSQHLDSLKIGETILLGGPKGHTEWKGSGKITVKPLGKPVEERYSRKIAMMAGGTGITPMLQVMHAIFRDTSDKTTQVKLVYANQTEEDILVRDELEALLKEFPTRFSLWYTVDRADNPNWKYDVGFMSKEMFEKHLVYESPENTQFFMCGPPPMIKFACLPALKELGYCEKDWIIF